MARARVVSRYPQGSVPGSRISIPKEAREVDYVIVEVMQRVSAVVERNMDMQTIWVKVKRPD